MTEVVTRPARIGESTVDRAARGDEAAFARLVAEHQPAMARVAYVICGDAELAREAAQRAWVLAWRRLATVRDTAKVGSWLVAVAANEARQIARQQHRGRITDLSAAMDHRQRDPADVIDLVDLQRALARLTPDERRLLALRYVAGQDSTEIARHLRLSASGVRSRLSRAIERLRTDLDHA